MGLPVSETSLKETCEGRNVVEVGVLQLMVGRDGVSPHQVPHTEIFKPLIEGKTGHGALQDTLREGIWLVGVSGPVPGIGGPPPDVGIGVDTMRVVDVRRIIPRYVAIVVFVVVSIRAGGVVGHLLVLLVSDEGDDGIVPPNHHPLYNLPLGSRHQHSLLVDPLAHRVWLQHLSQIVLVYW